MGDVMMLMQQQHNQLRSSIWPNQRIFVEGYVHVHNYTFLPNNFTPIMLLFAKVTKQQTGVTTDNNVLYKLAYAHTSLIDFEKNSWVIFLDLHHIG